MTDAVLFEETFNVTAAAPHKYERVTRLTGTGSAEPGLYMTLDVNTQLYPVAVGDAVSLCLASTLALDGSDAAINGVETARGTAGRRTTGSAGPTGQQWRDVQRGESTLADHFDYVCHGKVYRFEEDDKTLNVFASFGGLLLYITGPYKRLITLNIDYLYLLMRKA